MEWFVALIGAIAGVALVTTILALRQRRRCCELSSVAKAFAAGRYDQRAGLAGDDPLARLGRDLNDLGERLRQARDTVVRERELLASALSGLSEGVACIDATDQVLYANPAWRQLAAGGNEVIGHRWYESLPDPELVRLVEAARIGFIDEHALLSHRRRRLDAGAVPAGGDGVVVLVLRDRTTIDALELQRRDTLAAISHELKTPLTAILGNADTLLSGALDEPGEVRRSFVERIVTHGERLSALISDVLTLARLERGAWEVRAQALDLVPILRAIADDHQHPADERGVTIAITAPDRVELNSDPELLRQLIGNLVGNAVRYNRPDGRVHLTVIVGASNGRIRVIVADTGVGIPSELHGRVFEPFFRVDPARSRSTGGTGLGLAIVRQLSVLLHATIDLSSSPAGTTFTVELPGA